jgi:hypothetical protein
MTTDQVDEPSHRAQAAHVRDKLVEQLQVLKFLENALRQRPAQESAERTRAVVTAIELLQQTMNALELAVQE